jgi:hypothetical protein
MTPLTSRKQKERADSARMTYDVIMADTIAERENSIAQLAATGLSETALLRSIGLATHRQRLEAGEIDAATLARYAADLRLLSERTQQAGGPIPVDFWDARTEAMRTAGIDEYTLVHKLAGPEFQLYIEMLARCFERMTAFKRTVASPPRTAVGTALDILQEVASYIRCDHTTEMTRTRPNLSKEQQAIFLWQQVLTGTNRQVPYLGRDAYTHSYWGRFNVTEMWRYEVRADIGMDPIWGLTGFDDAFIRDPHNTNQIEHMAITSLAQIVLRLPLLLLNTLEDLESLLHKASWIEGAADKALNRAVAHQFCPFFTLEAPQTACDRLERFLAQPK